MQRKTLLIYHDTPPLELPALCAAVDFGDFNVVVLGKSTFYRRSTFAGKHAGGFRAVWLACQLAVEYSAMGFAGAVLSVAIIRRAHVASGPNPVMEPLSIFRRAIRGQFAERGFLSVEFTVLDF